MITIEFESTEDARRLAVLQDGHQIGHVENMSHKQLIKQVAELNRAAMEMHLKRGKPCTKL